MEPEVLQAKQTELMELKVNAQGDENTLRMIEAHEQMITNIIGNAGNFTAYLMNWYEKTL